MFQPTKLEAFFAAVAFLLEELAEELCAEILQKFNPSSVTLRLSKPEAVKEALGVGIEITRCK